MIPVVPGPASLNSKRLRKKVAVVGTAVTFFYLAGNSVMPVSPATPAIPKKSEISKKVAAVGAAATFPYSGDSEKIRDFEKSGCGGRRSHVSVFRRFRKNPSFREKWLRWAPQPLFRIPAIPKKSEFSKKVAAVGAAATFPVFLKVGIPEFQGSEVPIESVNLIFI